MTTRRVKSVVYPDSTTYRAWQRLIASSEPVCASWRTSFGNFVADMGAEPSPEHVLVRADPTIEHRLANTRWTKPTKAAASQPATAAKGLARRAIDALRRRFGR